MNASLTNDQLVEHKSKVYKPMLWVAILSIVMIFAGLISAYVVRREGGNWTVFDLPSAFSWGTLVIAVSSLSLHLVLLDVKKNRFKSAYPKMIVTILLGLTFFQTQFAGFEQLIDQGIFFTGSSSTASGSFLYVIVLAHLAHVVGGLISLFVMTYKLFTKKYNANNYIGLDTGVSFWHFLGVLWIFLYLFLWLVR